MTNLWTVSSLNSTRFLPLLHSFLLPSVHSFTPLFFHLFYSSTHPPLIHPFLQSSTHPPLIHPFSTHPSIIPLIHPPITGRHHSGRRGSKVSFSFFHSSIHPSLHFCHSFIPSFLFVPSIQSFSKKLTQQSIYTPPLLFHPSTLPPQVL